MATQLRSRPAGRPVRLLLALWIALLLPLADAAGRGARSAPCAGSARIGAAATEAASGLVSAERSCCSVPAPTTGCCCARPRSVGLTAPCATGTGVDHDHDCGCCVGPGETPVVTLLPPAGEGPGVDPPAATGRVRAARRDGVGGRSERAAPRPRARSGPDLVERHRTYRI